MKKLGNISLKKKLGALTFNKKDCLPFRICKISWTSIKKEFCVKKI